MSIKSATISDLGIIKQITHKTITEIYPHYYSDGAVSFFLNHHNENNIIDDIKKHCVYICVDTEDTIVGTVTIKNNEICRLFVLTEYQGNGYAKNLIDFIVKEYADKYSVLQVGTGDSPLTVPFYEKCGFVRSHIIPNFFTNNYDHPIFECGVRLTDMVIFQRNL